MWVIGEDGVEREEPDGYIIRDGERIRTPMRFMDEVQRSVASALHDAAGESWTCGHKPGFLLADARLRDAAERARTERMLADRDAWRDGAPASADDAAFRERRLTDAELARRRDEAWLERGNYMRDAWRPKVGA